MQNIFYLKGTRYCNIKYAIRVYVHCIWLFMIDPIAFHLGPIAVHWYGIAYVVGILCAWKVANHCAAHYFKVATTPWDTLINPAIWGIILGGRLGHVLLFDLPYYTSHPLEIVMIWKGGMSFHGGFLGVIIAMIWHAQQHNMPFWRLADAAACGTPWALFFGRVANWVNGELYGRVTDVPWAQVFPHAGALPRHPSQLYEAAGEGLLLGLLMLWAAPHYHAHLGRLSGIFGIGYGLTRFSIEYVREIDWAWGGLTAGQWYCLPMIGYGLWLIYTKRS